MEQKLDKDNLLPWDTNNILSLDIRHHLTLISYNDESLYSDLPKTKFINFEQFELFEQFEVNRQHQMPEGESYPYDQTIKKEEMNSYNYRSDDFINDHNGKHILFVGDSNTWGSGLLYEEQWSRKLYKLFTNNENLSGYFNIGCIAASIFHSIITSFKYFKQFGNPNCVFFNIPKLNLLYAYDEKLGKITDGWYGKHPIMDLLTYQYYFMLESYCESNDIKLLSYTGYYSDPQTKEALSRSKIDQFKTFYKFDEDEVDHFIKEYKENNKHLKEAKYFDKARVEDHDGIAYHAYWAEFMYKKYLEL
jgi:hypothetical protein